MLSWKPSSGKLANCDLSHIARGSSGSLFQELSFVKDLAFSVALPTHML